MDLPAGQILILSGPPGSGKTTTAAALAHRPGGPKVHLHTDDYWGNIKHGLIAHWLPESDGQNRMIASIAASVAGQYARHGYFVAADGVVRPWWLPWFVALGVPVHYVVLRPGVDEAVARCLARGGDSLTDPVVVADLHGQFADLGAHERHVLATGGMSPEVVLQAVLEAVAGGRYRL